MPATPLVSIIIPAHAAESCLARCLASIAAQTFGDMEAIVINDASPDGTQEVIDSFVRQDSRFRGIVNTRRSNAYDARLTGFTLARGDYLACCDADDAMPPSALENLYAIARHENADIVHGRARILTAGGPEGIFPAADPFLVRTGRDYVKACMRFARGWSVWGKLYRRELWLRSRCYLPRNKNWFAGDDLLISYFFGIHADKYATINTTVYHYQPPHHDYFSLPERKTDEIRGQMEILQYLLHSNSTLPAPLERGVISRACRHIAGSARLYADAMDGFADPLAAKKAFGLELGVALQDNHRQAVTSACDLILNGNIREARIALHRLWGSLKRRGMMQSWRKLLG